MSILPPIKEEKRKKKRKVKIKAKEPTEDEPTDIIEFKDSSPRQDNIPVSTSNLEYIQKVTESNNDTKGKTIFVDETNDLPKTSQTQFSNVNPTSPVGNSIDTRKNNPQTQSLIKLKMKSSPEVSDMSRHHSIERNMLVSNNSPDLQKGSTFQRQNTSKHNSIVPQVFQNTNYTPSSFGQYYSQPAFQNSPLGYSTQHQIPYYGNSSPLYYPQSSFFNQTLNHKNDEHDKKLLDLIERQTEVIGHLNSKILNQEYQKLLKGRKELSSRLKQLEFANAMKQKELDARIQNNLISSSMRIKVPDARIQEDTEKKHNKSSRVLQILSKFVIANEMANTERRMLSKPRPHGSLLKHAIDELRISTKEEASFFPFLSRRNHTENDQIYNELRNSNNKNQINNSMSDD